MSVDRKSLSIIKFFNESISIIKTVRDINPDIVHLISMRPIIIGIISSLFVINKFSGSDYIFKKLPIKSQVLIRSISSNKKSGNSFFHFFNNLFNDYNTKFLPETQFIDLDFKTFKVEFDKTYKNKYLKKTDNPKNFFYSFYRLLFS